MSAGRPAADQPPPRIMVVSCPDLHRAQHVGPSRETAQRHERVINAVTGFCPKLEVVEPGVCAFGARGPARYFGGETALAARIIAAVADLGAEVRAGVADGLFAALLAARGGDPVRVIPPGGSAGFLAAQPVSVLADQDLAAQDLVALLKRLGLGTLGDFAALPARDVASRFGDAGECAHRLARGLDSRPLAARPPPADLSVTQRFDPPEPRAEPVVFVAKAVAERLHEILAACGLTCVRVQVKAAWADGRESTRRWRHDGLLSAAAVADRVRWQLDGCRPARPEDESTPGGITTLRLAPDQVVRATGQQLALWGETLVSDRVARAAMRVQAMLGHEAVLRPVLGGGRNASDQVTPIPFGEKSEPRLAADRPWPGRVMGAAPGLVFPAAREADVTDDAGRAVTVSGRCAVSAAPARLAVRGEPPRRVTGWAGPWPLSERWWDPAAARRRARFQLATEDGRAWLAVVKDGRWLVEGGYWLMGWDNPPVPWRELQRRMSWGTGGEPAAARRPAGPRKPAPRPSATTPWAELHCHSSFSFLDGAATPGELVAEAARLGLEVLALTDHDGMYGVPQFAQAAARLRDRGIHLGTVFGAELSLGLPSGQAGKAPDPAGRHLLVLARDPEGYRRLCAVISAAQLAGGEKGRPVYDPAALAAAHGGHWVVLTGCRKGAVPAALAAGGPEAAWRELAALTEMFGHEHVMVELTCQHDPGDDERNDVLFRLAALADLGVVATGNVHFAAPAQARLGQALAAIRARRSLADMDGWLPAAGTAYLRSGPEMTALLRRYPGVLDRTVELGRACAFDFRVIAPRLPDFPVPPGHTEASWLSELVARKAPARYGSPGAERVPGAHAQIARELEVIERLEFGGYFLIVHDIVEFCDDNDILCQGRGSAANSAVCFALGITSVDPVSHHLLFERFLSEGRDGPPDIDLDIEHRRREEVIQYVYRTYGRDRAAQVANVISYRPRMALRDAGRALGHTPAEADAWAREIGPGPPADGEALPARVPAAVAELAARMQRLPRHLGIHSGGMVICDRPVGEVCPVEWARMPGRTVLQWDKDDCAYAGLVKIDLLGLGMLAALHDCFNLVTKHYGEHWTMSSIPQEDPAVYQMLAEADTVGVFQVESRAQMATLPRLRPQQFYDLVIEVALIRPGPIQGGSVHPYLRRHDGLEDAAMPHESMRPALGKTLGVPLFQEQMMQLAIDCAGFTPDEADRLRQAMSAKRAPERIEELRQRLLDGMAERGIGPAIAEDIYAKILAFSSYGFPESHAISFAYLVYASAWLKRYYPAAFTAALLRNQPMGFYAPHSLINDARRHGVVVRGVDVNAGDALATLEGSSPPAVRLGLSAVRNLGSQAAERVAAGRPYRDLEDFATRTHLPAAALEALATAGAFGCFGLSRRAALWAAGAAASLREGQLPGTASGMTAPPLPVMTPAEETLADLWATSTYGTHPVAHVRAALDARHVLTAAATRSVPAGAEVVIAGLVTHRQRPPTARGVVFISLEDETGMVNVICPPQVWERHQPAATAAPALLVRGRIERTGGAVNLVAGALRPLRVAAAIASRDFR